MTSDAVRAIIREVLAEELQRLKPRAQVREERVSITSDADLAGFVARLLDMARNDQSRRDIEEKRLVFRLAQGPAPTPRAVPSAIPAVQPPRIESGMVSERQIDALPAGTARLVLGRSVRLTPLARDRVRARGITIERAS